jgi:hypothetical protein
MDHHIDGLKAIYNSWCDETRKTPPDVHFVGWKRA